ncbi:amidohydrolase family protein [Kribbella swartbergensis]
MSDVPVLLDCDVLVGHDVTTGRWSRPDAVRDVMKATGVSGGVVSSLRATYFDVPSGNDEARDVADGNGWTVCPVLDLRDPLGAERELDRLMAQPERPRAIRLAPTSQGVEPGFPAFEHVVRLLVEAGVTIFTEGDVRKVGPAFRGLGATVVFLDTHFYYLGDFVVLARGEPGFHTSTRMLTGPDSLEIVAAEVGAERLVLGCRTPFHETRSVVRRLLSSKLGPEEIALTGSHNLTRVLERP